MYTEREKTRTRSERNMDAKTDDKSAGKCPFSASAHKPRLVAGRAGHRDAPSELQPVRSDGQGIRLRQGVQEPRPQRRDQGPACLDDELAGVVAGRLRPLRRPDHPHGVALARAPTASPTAAAAPAPASSASRRSTAGRTTPTSTRRAGCCGRSSRSTAGRSPGPT